jgi:hypothetical protein
LRSWRTAAALHRRHAGWQPAPAVLRPAVVKVSTLRPARETGVPSSGYLG